MNRALILFSGTRSFEKVFERDNSWDCRGVDIDNHFKPYYNVDILKWDYKTALKGWIPTFIHASPVCKYFSLLKNGSKRKTDELEVGIKLVEKSLEIINYVLSINPQLLFTIENPVGHMRHLDIMKPYTRLTTSYCKYGFPYKKATDIWCNFDLVLEKCCSKRDLCRQSKKNNGIHPVRIGYKPTHDNQIICYKYFSELRKQHNMIGYSNTYFRYRIPEGLIFDIYLYVDFEVLFMEKN